MSGLEELRAGIMTGTSPDLMEIEVHLRHLGQNGKSGAGIEFLRLMPGRIMA